MGSAKFFLVEGARYALFRHRQFAYASNDLLAHVLVLPYFMVIRVALRRA